MLDRAMGDDLSVVVPAFANLVVAKWELLTSAVSRSIVRQERANPIFSPLS